MDKKQKSFALWIMAIMMVILNADTSVMAPKLALIEAEFKVSDTQIGLMMMLFTIIGAVVSLLWGYFSDKSSRKMLYTLAIVLGELPCALTALAPNYAVFFILRILAGIGLGASFPVVFSIVGDIFDDKERSWATGIISVAMAIGAIAGTAIGGYVGAPEDWRLPFVVGSAPNFLFLVLFLVWVPEPRKAASEEATKELVAAGLVYPKTIKWTDYASLFKTKTNLYLLLQGIVGTIPWGSFFFLNKYLNENKGLSVGMATLVYLVFGLGMVVGNVLGGEWGGRIYRKDPRGVPLFCAATTAGGALAVIYVFLLAPSNIILLSIFGFLAACLSAMTGPNTKTMLLDVNAPESRGAIFSIFNLTDSLGTGLGRGVAGILSGMVGLAASLAICSGLWFLCSVFMLLAAAVFVLDIGSLRKRMDEVAAEMRAAVQRGK
jgi:predicted MFS family arabinose efflux permease